MLARTADAVYWMGRYLERAENVTRLLVVASDFSVEVEGLDEELAQREWDTLLAALPGTEPARIDFSPTSGLVVPYIASLLLDPANPMSVLRSLEMARENARAIREALTREVFLELNGAYRELERSRRRPRRDPALAIELVGRTQRAILTTLGAIEHTLSRDEGWTFMKLGEALESTVRTANVLLARLPDLQKDEERLDEPLVFARWRGLLRSLSSLESFRRVHGGSLDPTRVIRFLLFDLATPRSVCCGFSRIHGYLDRLPGGAAVSRADRIVGRMLSKLRYEDETMIAGGEEMAFLGEVADATYELHEAVGRQYFLT